MATRGDMVHELVEALRAVRAAVAELSYPLPLPSAGPARADQAALLAQVDEYALPRLAGLDAPLLAVVGGSTGAGKSTLVNSLVRAPVSPAGVIRPTTRAPVLVCHPADTAWFRGGGRMRRVEALISAPALAAGVALLDVPDIDTLVDANRSLALQLLAGADLWLFVTTAARYADAIPWELLRTARQRGTVVALVLDRVPGHGGASQLELVPHLTELLTGAGLAGVPLFVLPETRVDGQGLLPEDVVAPLRVWFEGLAGDAPARAAVARCTLDGALAALPARIEALAAAAAAQVATAEVLAEDVGMAFGGARAALETSLPGGAPPAAGAGVRGRTGHRSPGYGRGRAADLRRSWEESLVTLVCSAAADAAERARSAWRGHPTGALITPDLAGPSPELARRVERLARAAGGGNGSGPEQRAALRDQLVALLEGEATRWLEPLAAVPPDTGPARRLREAGIALERARVAAGLGSDPAAAVAAPPPDQPPAVPEPVEATDLDRAGR